MSRQRRYLLVAGLLLLAGGIALSWQFLRGMFNPEMVDPAELEQLKAAKFTPPPPATGTDWPQYRGPNRDGVASVDDFNTDWEAKRPTVEWKTPVGGGYGSVAVAGGRVYVQDRQGGNERLVCLNAADGKEVWADAYPADYSPFKAGFADGPRGTPTIHDGRAYTVGAVGKLRCVKLGDKPELLWEHDLPAEYGADLNAEPLRWGFSGSPLIEGDLVIVSAGGTKGSVAAFDRTTGEPKWSVGSVQGAYCSPVVGTFGGVRQVVTMTGEAAVGIAVPEGKRLWEYPWITGHKVNAASPLIAGEFVFISSDYGKGCAVLRVTADGVKPVYVKPGPKGMKTKHSTAVHRDGFVYGSDEPTFRCLSLRDGKLVDDWEGPSRIDYGSPVLVGDVLLVQSNSGGLHLIAADPTEFRPRGELTGVLTGKTWATPAVVGGRVFTRDAGNVLCIDARK